MCCRYKVCTVAGFHSCCHRSSTTIDATTKPCSCTKYSLVPIWCLNIMNTSDKVLTTNQPQYLHNLISVQPCLNTHSSSMVTLARPPTRSSLKITNRSFEYAAPCLWNELPTDLRKPRQTQSPSLSPITHGSSSSSSPSSRSPLASSLSLSLWT